MNHMMRGTSRHLAAIALAAGILTTAMATMTITTRDALAVRPFVTDDARIVDEGQLEMEMWFELQKYLGGWRPGLHTMFGASFTQWLEVLVGGGLGLEPGNQAITVANPQLTLKLLLWPAEDDGTPGLALATGVTFPTGRGSMYDDATGFYIFAPLTTRLWDDFLQIHLNIGARGAFEAGHTTFKPYWGIGFEMEWLGEALPNLVGEVYSGDPFEALGPNWAVQWGFRHIISDYVQMDLTFGFQPDLEAREIPGRGGQLEYWGQLGLRIMWDAFTPGGRPGRFVGADGMTRLGSGPRG